MAGFPFQSFSPNPTKEEANPPSSSSSAAAAAVVEEKRKATPVKYLPLCHVYSATSPCVTATGSSNVMSKKVKARKHPLLVLDHDDGSLDDPKKKPSIWGVRPPKPPILHRYSRLRNSKRARVNNLSLYDSAFALNSSNNVPPSPPSLVVKTENLDDDEDDNELGEVLTNTRNKRRKTGCTELINLGVDSSVLITVDGPRLRENRTKVANYSNNNSVRPRQQRCKHYATENGSPKHDATENGSPNKDVNSTSFSSTKRWVRLCFDGVDPKRFIGLQCKVYWPLDADWYSGRIVGYDLKSDRHQVKYEDGDEENVILSNERIKFYISSEDMSRLRLSCNTHCSDTNDLDVDEMVVLAACLGDYHEIESGDIIWAKIIGHAVWPAIVLDESLVIDRKGLNKCSGEKSVVVQFFGTHDFARVRTKQVISFLKGLVSSYHLKCKKTDFIRSLEEAKV